MSEAIEGIDFKVFRTEHRHDAAGEFVVRLHSDAFRLLPRGCNYVAVRPVTGQLTADNERAVPEVIAAVRRFLPEDKWQSPPSREDCQLDMSLRVAAGVRGYDPQNGQTLQDVTGSAERVRLTPLARSIRPAIVDSLIGYQWMLFRVQRALMGDFETPISRVPSHYLASLGVHDGGVVIIESPLRQAVRRLLAASSEQRIEADPDFEQQLGVGAALRLPPIYLDKSARDQLGVRPGQVVWLRRELRSVLRSKLMQIASALALALVGIVFSVRELLARDWTWGDWAAAALILAIVVALVLCAVYECRDRVRAE